MQTRITRPDVRQVDAYRIELDETMLMWIEEGYLAKISHLEHGVSAHNDCDLRHEQGCRVRHDWLVASYGNLENAAAAGFYMTDCAEELSYCFTALGRLMDALTQSRWIRNNPTGKGLYEARDAQTQLKQIRGEVAHREEQGKVDTGHMPRLDEETLAKLDEQEAGASLLGLNETSTVGHTPDGKQVTVKMSPAAAKQLKVSSGK